MMDGRGEGGRRGRILVLSVQLAAVRCSFPADVKVHRVCRSIAQRGKRRRPQSQTNIGGKLGGPIVVPRSMEESGMRMRREGRGEKMKAWRMEAEEEVDAQR